MAGTGEWQVVRRRRRFPDNWKSQTEPPSPKTKPYNPYSSRPTYAQVLTRLTPSPPNSTNTSPRTSLASSQPPSPTSNQTTTYYTSPHNPMGLRFPPSTKFQEWRGRCFCCCRRGHTVATCRNPLKCGKCWHDGHTGAKCRKQNLNATVEPYYLAAKPIVCVEPMFDELLTGSYPYVPPLMLENRPDKVFCYIDRDEDYYKEVDKLQRAVIVHEGGLDYELGVDAMADLAMQTGLVRREELSVGVLSKARYLILLPVGLAPTMFIKAIPEAVWSIGVSFQPWSPLIDAEIKVPSFKVLIELVGIPLELWRKREVIRVVSHFGLYLGTISNKKPSDLERWRVAVAMDSLSQIPHNVVLVTGGAHVLVPIIPVSWVEAPIYNKEDFPVGTQVYTRPGPEAPTDSSEEDHIPRNDSETILIPYATLMELCRGREVQELPQEIQEYMAKENAPQKNVGAIVALQEAPGVWPQRIA